MTIAAMPIDYVPTSIGASAIGRMRPRPLRCLPAIRQRKESHLQDVGQRRRAHIEAQMYRARHLVDVLPTGPLRAHSGQFDFIGRDRIARCHGMVWSNEHASVHMRPEGVLRIKTRTSKQTKELAHREPIPPGPRHRQAGPMQKNGCRLPLPRRYSHPSLTT